MSNKSNTIHSGPNSDSLWVVFCGSLAYWFNNRHEAQCFVNEQKYTGLGFASSYSEPVKYCRDF